MPSVTQAVWRGCGGNSWEGGSGGSQQGGGRQQARRKVGRDGSVGRVGVAVLGRGQLRWGTYLGMVVDYLWSGAVCARHLLSTQLTLQLFSCQHLKNIRLLSMLLLLHPLMLRLTHCPYNAIADVSRLPGVPVSPAWICSHTCTCCHTETEDEDQSCYVIQS